MRQLVYGLRQSPREWRDTFRSALCDLGFCPSSADPLLFVRAGSTPFFIIVYIDDLVFATADKAALDEVKSELQKRHTCTDLGELQRYLGLQITRDRATRTITLTQSRMVQQVLRWFKFQFSTTQPTPLAVDHRITGPFPDEPFESSGPYAELVGCLIFHSCNPDRYRREPRCPIEPHCPARAALAATAASAATAATAATTTTAAMASPNVLTFDAEGRAVEFDVWVDDLQLFLQCDSKDGVSLFDHTSGVSPAPTATADTRYSSPATAALSHLMLPYLFPDLAAFATVADLITHLRTSDARYRTALPT
ncbi:unnamed protein product, partial [Closterium sp. NIES-54]